MAFPNVAGLSGSNSGGNVTQSNVDVTIAGTPSVGDRIIIAIAKDGTGLFTWPATPAFSECGKAGTSAYSQGLYEVRYRNWQEGDATTVSITHATESTAWEVLRIAAGTFDPNQPTTWYSTTSTGSANPNPPAHDPGGWGVEDTLWIAVAANDGDVAITAGPANYSGFRNDRVAAATGQGIAIAWRQNAVASEDPGVFTMTTEQWGAGTCAVRPSSATGSTASSDGIASAMATGGASAASDGSTGGVAASAVVGFALFLAAASGAGVGDATAAGSVLFAADASSAGVATAGAYGVGSPLAGYIGIPAPSFGLTETPPADPDPWTSDVPGFYYVDNVNGQDSGRTYGNPTAPRKTIPSTLAAGSYVQVVGATYNRESTSLTATFVCNGTAEAPVFITSSVDTVVTRTWQGPTYNHEWKFDGTGHTIVDGFVFEKGKVRFTGDYVAVRHCEFKDWVYSTPDAMVTGQSATNLVVYDCDIHDCGDWQAQSENDIHGVKAGRLSEYLWVLNCRIYHVGGDSVQLGEAQDAEPFLHHVYIGANDFYDNYEDVLDFKSCRHVIVSQNNLHGKSAVLHDDPHEIWFLFNKFYDSVAGIGVADSQAEGGVYFIGNLFYNISGPAIKGNGANASVYIVNNTFDDANQGVFDNTGDPCDWIFESNIFGISTTEQVNIPSQPAATSSVSRCVFKPTAKITWAALSQGTVAQFAASYPDAETDCIEDNPDFVDENARNYALLGSSPAIDAGAESAIYATFESLYGLDIRVDHVGNPRPANSSDWDIGAFEYDDSGSVGASDGTSGATGIGAAISGAALGAEGMAVASGIGAAIASGSGSINGLATSGATGAGTTAAPGTASGVATATAEGVTVAENAGAATATGQATCQGVATSQATAAAQGAGSTSSLAEGRAQTAATGHAAGVGDATAEGVTSGGNEAAGSSAGTATATGRGISTAAAAGVASAMATISGTGAEGGTQGILRRGASNTLAVVSVVREASPIDPAREVYNVGAGSSTMTTIDPERIVEVRMASRGVTEV